MNRRRNKKKTTLKRGKGQPENDTTHRVAVRGMPSIYSEDHDEGTETERVPQNLDRSPSDGKKISKSRSGKSLGFIKKTISKTMRKKKKRKFRAPSVSFTLDSSYEFKDESVASALSVRESFAGTPREVLTKRITFSNEEMERLVMVSNKDKPKTQKYDGVEASIYDKRGTEDDSGSDDDDDLEVPGTLARPPSYYGKRNYKNTASLDDELVDSLETKGRKGIEEDEDLKFVHNNRETKLDI